MTGIEGVDKYLEMAAVVWFEGNSVATSVTSGDQFRELSGKLQAG